MSDNVKHPSHYCKGGMECIDAIKAAVSDISDPFEAYCTGNIIKYIWRWNDKNGVEDLNKAKQYADIIIEYRASKSKPETGNPATDKPAENKPFDWDAFKTKKIAVHCDTEDKAKAFVAECKRRLPIECRRWKNDEPHWYSYGSETAYSIGRGELLFCDAERDREDDYTIVDYPFDQKKDNKPHQFTDEEAQDLFGKENTEEKA